MRDILKELYKETKNLEVKRNLLKLLNNKYLSLGLTDIDFTTEKLLDSSGFKCRYGRNYNTAIYEL